MSAGRYPSVERSGGHIGIVRRHRPVVAVSRRHNVNLDIVPVDQSRSVYSLMISKGQEAEYFSRYEVSDKGTSWLAPLVFGLVKQFTGSYRVAILSLVVFFIAGLAVLTRVDVRKAAIEAGNEAPTRA